MKRLLRTPDIIPPERLGHDSSVGPKGYALPGRLLRGVGTAFLFACMLPTVSVACPKILMFDGVDIRSQTDVEHAHYWAREVGVQGFFLNNIMGTWQRDVGSNPQSEKWELAKRFQRMYSQYGVTDNFIKVAIWQRHDWRDAQANFGVVRNFSHAAALARFAGFKGIALDMEPYVPIWGGAAGGEELAPIVYKEGKEMGLAMRKAYPGMTLVLIQDALYWASLHQGYHGGYALAVPFLRGLLSAEFVHVVFATELTYKSPEIAEVTRQLLGDYRQFIMANHLPVTDFSVAPGLWPLGVSYKDKSARMPPGQFGQELRHAYAAASDYVWIYGFGSAWQTDGPYGKGSTVEDFPQYLDVLHSVMDGCSVRSKGQ